MAVREKCEDAPCCGCCGTNVYGVDQEAESPEFCDRCMSYHRGDCPVEDDDYDEFAWELEEEVK